MDTYKTEDEQIESIKKWWGENGASIVMGVVLGLGAIFGWRWWTETKRVEAEAVSDLYQNLISATQQEERSNTQDIADEIIINHSSTPYAVFAKLNLASQAVSDTEYDVAMEHLRWAQDNVANEGLAKEIRLRIARILTAQMKFDDALKTLDEIDAGTFKGNYEELRGDIKVQQGDIEGARSAYQNAIIEMRLLQADTRLIEIKLDDLGRP